jgi:hypothetical protein
MTNMLAVASSTLVMIIKTKPREKTKDPNIVAMEEFDSLRATAPPVTIRLKSPPMPANMPKEKLEWDFRRKK